MSKQRKLRETEPRVYNQELPDYGKLYTLKDFNACVKSGGFIPYDGWGYYVKDGKHCGVTNWRYTPKDATHVLWFNR